MNDPKGSIWRKWDLHYHTPSSYDVTSDVTNQDIINDLQTRSIAAVAITDHHVMDVDRIRALKHLAGDSITVFPGIELRSELGGSKSVHFIGIFSPDADIHNIWTKLQGRLNLTSTDISDIGDENIYVKFEDAATCIHEMGGLVTVHAGGKSNSIEEISNSQPYLRQLKKDLTEKCIDIFEAKNTRDALDYENIVFPKIEMRLPIIVGSDTHHSSSDTVHTSCWIKADPTIAGLRRIISEPDRVYLGAEPPALERQRHNSTQFIQEVTYSKLADADLDEHWFADVSIPFNYGLVAIIGNKGSGKSALADTLGLLGSSRQEEYFSFLKAEKFRNPKQGKAECFEASLTWLSGDVLKRVLSVAIDSTAVERIKYIPQSYLETICNDVIIGKGGAFDRELKSVIYAHIPIDQRLGIDTFDDLIEFKTRETHESIKELQKNLHLLNTQVYNLEMKQTVEYRQSLEEQLRNKREELAAHLRIKPKEVNEPEKDQNVKNNMTDLSTKLSELRDSLGELEESMVNIRKQRELLIRNKALAERYKAKLQNIEQIISDFKDSVDEFSPVNLDINDIITIKINYNLIDGYISQCENDIEEKASNLNAEKEGSLADQKVYIKNEIKKLQSKLDAPNQEYQQYLEVLKSWKEKEQSIIGTPDTVGSKRYFEEEIEKLERYPSLMTELKIKREDILESIYSKISKLIESYRGFHTYIEDAFRVNPVATQQRKIGFSAEIVPTDFEDTFVSMIQQGRRGTFYGAEEGKNKLRKLIKAADFTTASGTLDFANKIDDALHTDLRDEKRPSVNVDTVLRSGSSAVDVYDYIYGLSYLTPKYTLKWGSTPIEQLSPGERGALLLVFYLLADTSMRPLVIDQPEENLDNETVYNLLVPCIKDAKDRRQVVIVTHNPNLAVVCDADQIIYCEIDKSDNHRMTYTTGSIENRDINIHLVDVLEGTRRAFDNRDTKYKLAQS